MKATGMVQDSRCRRLLPTLWAWFTGVAVLLGCATASSTIPWIPRNFREELGGYQDIVEAYVVEEDTKAHSADTQSGSCATTYAVASITRVLKGARRAGDKILLGGSPKIHANFPMTSGSRYVLLLQHDLSNDDYLEYEREECPDSSLLRRTADMKHPFEGIYTGYSDFSIRTTDGQVTVAVWAYKSKAPWMFLENYSFQSGAADPDRDGTLLITSYDKFMDHLERMIAEAAQPAPIQNPP